MIRIAISQAAFDAIAATLPLGSVGYENGPSVNGERLIWLAPNVGRPSGGDARVGGEPQRRHHADRGSKIEGRAAGDCAYTKRIWPITKGAYAASLFAHDREHLFERRGRSTKNAGIGAAQFKDQKSGACDPKSADGHGDERRDAATRHQPVAEKEKRRPSYDDHDERNGNGSRPARRTSAIALVLLLRPSPLPPRAPASQHPSKDGAPLGTHPCCASCGSPQRSCWRRNLRRFHLSPRPRRLSCLDSFAVAPGRHSPRARSRTGRDQVARPWRQGSGWRRSGPHTRRRRSR